MMRRVLLIMIGCAAMFGAAQPVSAHGGRTNGDGCHNDRKRGGYHCHGGGRSATAPREQRGYSPPLGLFAVPVPYRTAKKASAGRDARVQTRRAIPIIASGDAFVCSAVSVWDGDGPIWCAEGPRIRIADIAAREIDGECLVGHPCPDATGEEARDALVQLLGGDNGRAPTGHVLVSGTQLDCISRGSGKGNRTAARCMLPDGQDLGEAMVESGTALPWINR
jgi:endonuclease YncB( thermonuclease family)